MEWTGPYPGVGTGRRITRIGIQLIRGILEGLRRLLDSRMLCCVDPSASLAPNPIFAEIALRVVFFDAPLLFCVSFSSFANIVCFGCSSFSRFFAVASSRNNCNFFASRFPRSRRRWARILSALRRVSLLPWLRRSSSLGAFVGSTCFAPVP